MKIEMLKRTKRQAQEFLNFDSTTNRKVAITFPKCPGFSPNFETLKFQILKDLKLTLKF